MKNSPIIYGGLAALLTVSASANAQSTYTIFGTVDAAVTRVDEGGNGHVTGLTSGSNNVSRLGFKGSKDLGGGLTGSFWAEGTLGSDDGTASGFNFTRRTTVSLANSLGEIRLGRDYAPSYWNVTLFDPFKTRGVGQLLDFNGASLGSTNVVRNSNSVGYFLPSNLGGIYGQVQYAFGEQASTVLNNKAGNHLSGRFGYSNGPLNVAVAYGVTSQLYGANNGTPPATGADLKTADIGGSYDFGVVKAIAYAGSSRVEGGSKQPNSRLDTIMLAATAPLGASLLRASFSRYDLQNSSNDAYKFALGYVYNLDSSTAVYVTGARLQNKGTAQYSVAGKAGDEQGITTTLPAPGRASTGGDVGFTYSF